MPDPITRQDVERAMLRPPPTRPDWRSDRDEGLRAAATLCPIVERGGEYRVILTRRSADLRAHPGQISFPGGKIDAGDAGALDAALRESEEEIGLDRGRVEIVGALDPFSTGTGFLVTTFIGFVPSDFDPVAEPGEVEEVFEAPLDFLMDRDNHEPQSLTRGGRTRHFYVINYRHYRIWGATAGMLHLLAERIEGARRERRTETVE